MLYFPPIYHDIGLKGENSTTKWQQKAYHNNYRTLTLIDANDKWQMYFSGDRKFARYTP